MKYAFYTCILVLALSAMACRKKRTCSCSVNEVTRTTTTIGGTTTTNEVSDDYSETYTVKGLHKKTIRHDYECYKHTEVETHEINNGTREISRDYNCELK